MEENAEKTWFKDVLVENCHIYQVTRTGLSTNSSWWKRSKYSDFGDKIGEDSNGNPVYDNWVPSQNVVFRNNRLEHIGGNGIIIRVADKPVIEKNYLYYCGEDISGNAAFCFNTDSALFQWNEACYTVYNEGDTDARGIDSDYRSKHTIIQYNYLHNNGYGGVVATGGPGGETSVPRFNVGTVIRYNILVNNKDHVFRTSGKLTNLSFYNNVIYSDDTLNNITLVDHGSWRGASASGVYFHNNIFYILGNNPMFDFGESLHNYFSHNVFYGNHAINEPKGEAKITSDPQFIDPEEASNIDDLGGFKLQPESPCINTGKYLEGMPDKDFYGNPIGKTVDRGVYETGEEVGIEFEENEYDTQFRLFPNPAREQVNMRLKGYRNSEITCSIIDMQGKILFEKQILVGKHEFSFSLILDQNQFPNGLYFLRVKADNRNTQKRKLIVL